MEPKVLAIVLHLWLLVSFEGNETGVPGFVVSVQK